jgi:hypothetical protein
MARLRFFKLCWRAPPILMNLPVMAHYFAIRPSNNSTPTPRKKKAAIEFDSQQVHWAPYLSVTNTCGTMFLSITAGATNGAWYLRAFRAN